MQGKVEKWMKCIDLFSEAAIKCPHAVYSAFTKPLQAEWIYLQRVVSDCGEEFVCLREKIQCSLIPAILGREILKREFKLFEMPVKWGGLSFRDPVDTAYSSFNDSDQVTSMIQYAIMNGSRLDVLDHNAHVASCIKKSKDVRENDFQIKSEALIEELPVSQKKVLNRIVEAKVSGWLSVLPRAVDGFDLSAEQFRDRVAQRYGKQPLGLPVNCDGCGKPFSLQHGLSCMKGGLVKQGHDNLRDECIKLSEMAWGGVTSEPLIKEESGRCKEELRADFCVRGVWEGNRTAFFDNRILDADAKCRLERNISWKTALKSAAEEKKRKYRNVCEDIRSSFTPLVITIDGCLHREFEAFLKRLAARLASKWKSSFSYVLGWVKVRIQFALIKATDLRLRGTRKRISGLGLDDGAGIMFFPQ